MDGVICTEEKTFSRSLAVPLPGAVESLLDFKRLGHTIVIFTARSWNEYEMTEDWLNKYAVPFDRLICGKPIGDLVIDDRAIAFTNWKEVKDKVK